MRMFQLGRSVTQLLLLLLWLLLSVNSGVGLSVHPPSSGGLQTVTGGDGLSGSGTLILWMYCWGNWRFFGFVEGEQWRRMIRERERRFREEVAGKGTRKRTEEQIDTRFMNELNNNSNNRGGRRRRRNYNSGSNVTDKRIRVRE